jgi:hypothetical protein
MIALREAQGHYRMFTGTAPSAGYSCWSLGYLSNDTSSEQIVSILLSNFFDRCLVAQECLRNDARSEQVVSILHTTFFWGAGWLLLCCLACALIVVDVSNVSVVPA